MFNIGEAIEEALFENCGEWSETAGYYAMNCTHSHITTSKDGSKKYIHYIVLPKDCAVITNKKLEIMSNADLELLLITSNSDAVDVEHRAYMI